ncbi:1119_t:CDS:2 [Diversispora eburnea]|uniref:1119_t:CDS:1 n=1 Tax=Diversispora eburnea TaxID=1213867 RepID=A0A9N9C878_9GLOM|nr:1119_t:CDS:2 [Diversispora eburnea]
MICTKRITNYVTAHKTKTITQTRGYTRTIYPTNCTATVTVTATNGCYFKNKYTKIVFCKPTVYLPCPEACTETVTSISTSIATTTSLYTSLSTFTSSVFITQTDTYLILG